MFVKIFKFLSNQRNNSFSLVTVCGSFFTPILQMSHNLCCLLKPTKGSLDIGYPEKDIQITCLCIFTICQCSLKQTNFQTANIQMLHKILQKLTNGLYWYKIIRTNCLLEAIMSTLFLDQGSSPGPIFQNIGLKPYHSGFSPTSTFKVIGALALLQFIGAWG